jgi:hypothetical protein
MKITLPFFYCTCESTTSVLTDRFLIKSYLDLKTGKYSTSCTLKFASLSDVNKESENHANTSYSESNTDLTYSSRPQFVLKYKYDYRPSRKPV